MRNKVKLKIPIVKSSNRATKSEALHSANDLDQETQSDRMRKSSGAKNFKRRKLVSRNRNSIINFIRNTIHTAGFMTE